MGLLTSPPRPAHRAPSAVARPRAFRLLRPAQRAPSAAARPWAFRLLRPALRPATRALCGGANDPAFCSLTPYQGGIA